MPAEIPQGDPLYVICEERFVIYYKGNYEKPYSKLENPLPWTSGNSVAIQCAWNLDPIVYRNATEERIVGSQCVSSVLPVVFQWPSCGVPLCSNMVIASASVVPVASPCTCGASGLPVWSVQWYPNALTESCLEVIKWGHFPACNSLCIELVWWELF